MRLRALVLFALLLVAAPARAADHPLTWPDCCSAAPYTDVPAAVNDSVTFTGDFYTHPLVWDYGDFTTENTGPSRQYTFTAAGTYPFHCAVHSNMHGRIKVGTDQHATADLSVSSATVTTADPVTFTYTGTADPDGTIASYEWDYNGDGTTDQTTAVDHATHTYSVAGTFPATVRVRDNGHELSGPAPAKTIAVTAAPSTAPPGDGGQPPAADGPGAPPPGPTPDPPANGADATPPSATHIRVSGGRLRFTLSENASFRAHLVRAGKNVRQLGVSLKAGAVAYRLPRHLKRGRYTIRFVLTDGSGNHSRTYSASFRVT